MKAKEQEWKTGQEEKMIKIRTKQDEEERKQKQGKKTEEEDLQENRERTKRRMCVGSGIRN